jgi:FixJ family two-component response regulator
VSRRPLVAVVDDDLRVLESLEDLLESAGYAARTFTGGEALLADACLPQVDCLVSDIAMPLMDGYELQRRIHRVRPGLPLIFITAHDSAAVPGVKMPSRAVLLRKPFEGPAMLATIKRVMQAFAGDRP